MTKLDVARITVLIPAFNEAERIGEVVRSARSAAWVDRLVVINDGSADETVAAAAESGAEVIDLRANLGKGGALQAGIDATLEDTDIYLFLDADLLGLTKLHLRQLVRPLLYEPLTVMTVGKFASGRLTTDLSQFVLPILNGQRALRCDFVRALPDLREYRYGVEVLLSKIAESRGQIVREVRLKGLAQVMKEEKQGVMKGTMQRYKMYYECLEAWRKYLSAERKKQREARRGRSSV